MTLRIQFAIGVAVAAIILPIIVAQAQSEGETQSTGGDEPTVAEQQAADAAQEQNAPAAEATQDTAAAQEAASAEGEVLGESDVAGGNTSTATESSATTTEPDLLEMENASSTEATSTPPIEEPKPIEEPFVLQPGVELTVNGNTVSAVITLENLTCKSCEKVLPELEVLTYYTRWYPNDGPIGDYAEASEKSATQARSVADLPVKATRDLAWSAEVPSGRYYFVVEVDPENAHGAYRLFRSEFSI